MPTERINGFDMYYEVAGQGFPLLFVHGGLGGGRGSALFRQHHMPMLAQYGQEYGFQTDETFRVSSTFREGWDKPDFQDATWATPVTVAVVRSEAAELSGAKALWAEGGPGSENVPSEERPYEFTGTQAEICLFRVLPDERLRVPIAKEEVSGFGEIVRVLDAVAGFKALLRKPDLSDDVRETVERILLKNNRIPCDE